jgi:hypothetical protein
MMLFKVLNNPNKVAYFSKICFWFQHATLDGATVGLTSQVSASAMLLLIHEIKQNENG